MDQSGHEGGLRRAPAPAVLADAVELALAGEPPPRGARQRWLHAALRGAMLAGRLPMGLRLPSTRALAGRVGVARGTVVSVYEQLAAEGLVEGGVGRGTFVSASLPCAPAAPAGPGHGSSAPAALRGPLAPALARAPFPLAAPAGPPVPLAPNAVDLAGFPAQRWGRLLSVHGRRADLLADADPAGLPGLRTAIAAHLAAGRGVACRAEQVLVVSGAQQALDLVARLLLAPGDAVLVEDPGYPGARQVLLACGARLVPCPVDAQGLRLPAARDGAPGVLACVTPARQAPLGHAMSVARRAELLRWAQRHGAWVFEDDYDSEFRWRGPPRAALKALDERDRVILAGSFSKLMFPALRLGFVVAPRALVAPLTRALALTARFASPPLQAALAEFLQTGDFARHLRRQRTLHAARAAALEAALRRDAAGLFVPARLEAGLDAALRFATPRDDRAIVARLARLGVEARALSRYGVDERGPSGLVVGFAAYPPAAIREAVRAIARVVRADRSVPSGPGA